MITGQRKEQVRGWIVEKKGAFHVSLLFAQFTFCKQKTKATCKYTIGGFNDKKIISIIVVFKPEKIYNQGLFYSEGKTTFNKSL